MIIFSAPSGAGKTTLVRHLLSVLPEQLHFSISATSRSPRPGEIDGIDYFFLPPEVFEKKVQSGAFLEWEEVYPGLRYGTLVDQVEKAWQNGKAVIFDMDVKGGRNLKQRFGDTALAIFVKPPNLAALEERLRQRGTESEGKLQTRLAKAQEEIAQAPHFDHVILNDQLAAAQREALQLVRLFLGL